MSADNREQLFEKALARHLRQSGRPVSSGHPTASCPDAETLAAYHERTLSLDELNQWKQHFVGCERCRAVLAQLELTDDIPDDIPVAASDLAVGPRFSASPSLAQAAPSGSLPPPQPAAVSAASSEKTVTLPSRRRYWHWIAPAGAIAAGLFVWIAWRENRPPSLTPLPTAARTDELARTAPPASLAPVPPKSQAEPEEKRERDSDALVAQTPPPAGFLDEKKAAELHEHEMVIPQRDAGSAAALRKSPRLVVPQAPAPGPSNRALQQQNTPQQNERVQLDVPPSAGALGVVGGAKEKEMGGARQESAGAAPNAPLRADKVVPALSSSELAAPPPPPQAAPVISAAASAQKPSNKPAEKKDDTKLARSGASVESSQSAASLNYTAAIAANGARLIPVPGGKVVWKITENGAVQRSTDSGVTWQPQDTGVNARLLAGSAPSDKVCWLAGSFGVVLLTTDGGAHWTKLSLPVNSPVGEITATDARNATATLRSSTVRFSTADGGQTWSLVKP